MKVLLNLGCGNRLAKAPGPGWHVVNHDRLAHREGLFAWDLNVYPWPWPDGSVARILAWQVLEHLREPLAVSFDECWRILKPGGLLEVNVPLWRADRAHDDPTHRWWVSKRTLEFFDPDKELGHRFAFYGLKPWRIVKQLVTGDGASLCAVLEKRGTQ